MKYFVVAVLSILAGVSFAKETKFSGNPIIDGWYADPQIRIYDNKYWIFPTYSQAFKKQLHLDAYSSDNLVDWKKHSRIIDNSSIKWLNKALWAPDSVKKDGKYFGPFMGGVRCKDILEMVAMLYNVRTCKVAVGEKPKRVSFSRYTSVEREALLVKNSTRFPAARRFSMKRMAKSKTILPR